MSILHFAYLFDPTDFQKEITPLLDRLNVEDYSALREKAWEVAQRKPDIWKILENHFYGPDNFLPEYENSQYPNTNFWFLVILSQFLKPIPSFGFAAKWQEQYLRIELLKKGLKLIGWHEDDCILLIQGMSPCSLLLPNQVKELITQNRVRDLLQRTAWVKSKQGNWERTHWCDFEGGWLDRDNIERLYSKLQISQNDFLALRSNRELLLQEWDEGIPKPDAQTLIELLQTSYKDSERILTTAKESAKCLFLITS